MNLKHNPKTVIRDMDFDPKDPSWSITSPKRYSQRSVCANCHESFKVWILFGKPKSECKDIVCPNCGCETKV